MCSLENIPIAIVANFIRLRAMSTLTTCEEAMYAPFCADIECYKCPCGTDTGYCSILLGNSCDSCELCVGYSCINPWYIGIFTLQTKEDCNDENYNNNINEILTYISDTYPEAFV